MRITGGILAGRHLEVPGSGVRPTQDKVRAALFSSLGDFAHGAHVLDLYAGSGALGIEAWSRGAARVCWVEAHRRVFPILKRNVEQLCVGGGGVQCRMEDAPKFLDAYSGATPFQLILADPPYDREMEQGRLERLLTGLERPGVLASGGFFIYEQSAGEPVAERAGWILVKEKKYGDTRLLYYTRERGSEAT